MSQLILNLPELKIAVADYVRCAYDVRVKPEHINFYIQTTKDMRGAVEHETIVVKVDELP